MRPLAFLLSLGLHSVILEASNVQSTSDGGAASSSRRARVAGALRLGALFAVHGAPAAAAAGRAACGPVREHYGIQRVEATLQALDHIAHSSILPGLPLGAELRDSCWAPSTALRQTIDLVRAADPDACRADTGGGASPLLGVLGPGASAAAAQVQNLLQLFAIPQVSYSATAHELSDRARFATFFRVVPSDRHQARLLHALLAAHNWSYVLAVHTDESYGAGGMAAFREEAARGGVCVARAEALRAAPSPAEVDAALGRLLAGEGPRVCVCWCEGRTARALLAGIQRRGSPLRLLASDGWADRGDVVAGLERVARGSLTLRIRSPYLRHFDAYYHALSPHDNRRNPWFQEFWEQKFNCSLAEKSPDGVHKCTGSESLAEGYTQEPKLALVVRGVWALAHALHNMREALCPPPALPMRRPALCAAMVPFNVSLYQRYLARVKFRAPDGGLVAFDENGDPPPELSEYDVMQLVGSPSRGWRYARVGRWRRGELLLKGGPPAAARRAAGWSATCSAPCRAGWYARGGRCCWTCVPCPPLAVTRADRAGCRLCPPGSRPDAERTACLPSPVEWGGAGRGGWARHGAAGAGGAGLVATLFVSAVLWRHRATPVVKSASRELCALQLCAAALCHCAALAAALRPGAAACATVRLAAPALGAVYAALLLRTARMARLVAARGRRPTLVSTRASVLGWAVLSSPGACAASWAALQWPAAPRVLHPTRARAVLACGGEQAAAQLVPLAPALVLLLACTVVAIRARRLPHNFNETRFVGAAAYGTCVTWLAFFPLYAAAEARTAALCGCVSLSAGGAALLALGPRVYVCLCRPQRNTRAHFLTASIRCHLGKYRPAPGADEPIKPRAICRDAHSQTARPARCAGARCASTGACARVTQSAPDGDNNTFTVSIALLHHHHHEPGSDWEDDVDDGKE